MNHYSKRYKRSISQPSSTIRSSGSRQQNLRQLGRDPRRRIADREGADLIPSGLATGTVNGYNLTLAGSSKGWIINGRPNGLA
jgi:hypothetical protein